MSVVEGVMEISVGGLWRRGRRDGRLGRPRRILANLVVSLAVTLEREPAGAVLALERLLAGVYPQMLRIDVLLDEHHRAVSALDRSHLPFLRRQLGLH